MRLSIPCLATIVAALLLSGCAGILREYKSTHALNEAPLATYVRSCTQPRTLIGREGLEAVEVSPAVGPHHRPLYIGGVVADSVSVRTGHRMMYAFKDAGYFFANVKIEQSYSGKYARDKEAILRATRSLQDTGMILAERVVNTLPLLEYENTELDRGGVVGMYTIFFDRDRLVITAYLLSQEKRHRRFNTIGEYRALRDRFLDDLTTCVTAAADMLRR
jgi:hypothetical protein